MVVDKPELEEPRPAGVFLLGRRLRTRRWVWDMRKYLTE